MFAKWIKRILGVAILAAIIGGLIYALQPVPVPVDTAAVEKGVLKVTVDEEGKTRIREIYQVSAPIAGKVLRSPREVGDKVVANKTVVAVIQPGDPSFLDARARRELQAAVAAGQAAVAHARTTIRKAETELKFARSDLRRSESLVKTNVISERAMEKSTLEVDVKTDALEAAKADLELRLRELDSAKARLIGPESPSIYPDNPMECCVQVRTPVDGRVLKITAESEKVVQSGAQLLEIGNPRDLEIVVELLSTDAVKVKPGADAVIERWGRAQPLKARVNRIEPSGFTKVSALGIEEQRVITVLDILDPVETWAELGHDFRVYTRIAVWSADSVLRVPLSALFRRGGEWAVFVMENGEARETIVKLGHRNAEFAELVEGLDAGARVILHPSDRVQHEVRVAERKSLAD